MATPTPTSSIGSNRASVILLGALSVAASFTLGVRTSGDVATVSPLQAEDSGLSGDMNDDGMVTIDDAVVLLSLVRGDHAASPDQLQRDPDGDGTMSIDDAIMILEDVAARL